MRRTVRRPARSRTYGETRGVLIDDVEIGGVSGMSVWVEDGVIREVGQCDRVREAVDAEHVEHVAACGAALLPGLHDHHIHLFALAARASSVWCGPPEVMCPEDLLDRLRDAASQAEETGWLRAVGWDDTTAGWPDRWTLDGAVPDRPVRVQHRSGAMWVLNSAALASLHMESDSDAPAGVETDGEGVPTGRLFGLDDWLRDRIGGDPPSLREVSVELAGRGVTGVTDATAHNGRAELDMLAAARRSGDLAQRVTAMTGAADVVSPEGVDLGPVKIVLAEAALPSSAELTGQIRAAHEEGRSVAVHAVSRVTVLLAVVAFVEAGSRPGDRIEHASVVPPEALGPLAELGVTVVTQPHFVKEHGDRYRATVEVEDQPWLYRLRAFLEAGIPLAAGSDAPFGKPDPWATMAAAVERRTAAGHLIGHGEALTPEQALALFTGNADRPGGSARLIEPGAPADLCLLDRSWAEARHTLADVRVRATLVAGRIPRMAM